MPDIDAHRARRAHLLSAWRDAVAILPTNGAMRRNGDVDYPFRADSDFAYLTGFDEPDAILVLCPGRDEGEVVLFLRPRDPEREVWDGRRLGVERAPDVLGVDQAFDRAEFESMLPELLAGRSTLHYKLGKHDALDRSIIQTLTRLRAKPSQRYGAPERISDPGIDVHEMRLFKDDDELARMRHAAEITAEGHRAAVAIADAGRNEGELQARLEGTFRELGGTGPAYQSIVGSGANATILHYTENDALLRDGTTLLIDAGCEYRGYAADLTRTYPIGDRFGAPHRRLYDIVLAAQEASIATVTAGRAYSDFHDAAFDVLLDGLFDLGWLEGSRDEVLESKSYRTFYPHKTGHWLGRDVHDVGCYFQHGSEHRALLPGMVLTVEPGLYVPEDCAAVPPEYRGIGIRIEDDVLVTPGAPDILTPQVPKQAEELEAWCAEARSR